MSELESPATQIAVTGEPQPLSRTDSSPYAMIGVVCRETNATSIRTGGRQITATTGGKHIDKDDTFWFPPVPGHNYKMTEIFVVGTANDWVDTVAVRW